MHILWFSLLFLFNYQPSPETLVILEKEITVSGNTSLGQFNCTHQEGGLKDTLFFTDHRSKDYFLFDIKVADFSCGNFLLNNDFRKTIKAKMFPQAHVRVSNFRKRRKSYSCDLHLEIVGKKLFFKDFKLSTQDNKLIGKLMLDFKTLDLAPPRKLGGLVKVEEELSLSLAITYER